MADLVKARWEFFRRRPGCAAPSQPFGTWLQLRREGNAGYRAGCSVCEAAQGLTASPWSRFAITEFKQWRLCRVEKHGNSRQHRLACAKTADAPSADTLLDVLKDIRGKVGSKNHALKWCLNEGLRQVQWLMLRNRKGGAGSCDAKTIAISQDVRNHRLLLRLTMSSEHFHRSSFVIGLGRCLGTDSHQLALTTKSLINDFATACANVPTYGNMRLLPAAEVRDEPSQNILDIIHSRTEALVTDAASDEMKSGRLLSGKEQSRFATSLFPNLLLHSCYLIFRCCLVALASSRAGLVWSGLVWSGLVWSGLVWSGWRSVKRLVGS